MSATKQSSATLTERVQEDLVDSVDWSDADEAVETTLAFLRGATTDPAFFGAVLGSVDAGETLPRRSAVGAIWFLLAESERLDATLWLRYCPRGAVVPTHSHERPFVGAVLSGTYKQTLHGIGGGVDSPDVDGPLTIRTEGNGQVFALAAGQKHSSASSLNTMLLVIAPFDARDDHAASTVADDAEARSLVRKLRGAMRAAGLAR